MTLTDHLTSHQDSLKLNFSATTALDGSPNESLVDMRLTDDLFVMRGAISVVFPFHASRASRSSKENKEHRSDESMPTLVGGLIAMPADQFTMSPSRGLLNLNARNWDLHLHANTRYDLKITSWKDALGVNAAHSFVVEM
ncbi:hypothetical protein HAX54_053464 [Datura stramonium]|uniref:Uncharacterized protein n=1 Tax=Datura stramonium TaxID=4076 RepID=A0ABS8WPK8_DATST|nr:hypothetical protein [Datura stramonium]